LYKIQRKSQVFQNRLSHLVTLFQIKSTVYSKYNCQQHVSGDLNRTAIRICPSLRIMQHNKIAVTVKRYNLRK